MANIKMEVVDPDQPSTTGDTDAGGATTTTEEDVTIALAQLQHMTSGGGSGEVVAVGGNTSGGGGSDELLIEEETVVDNGGGGGGGDDDGSSTTLAVATTNSDPSTSRGSESTTTAPTATIITTDADHQSQHFIPITTIKQEMLDNVVETVTLMSAETVAPTSHTTSTTATVTAIEVDPSGNNVDEQIAAAIASTSSGASTSVTDQYTATTARLMTVDGTQLTTVLHSGESIAIANPSPSDVDTPTTSVPMGIEQFIEFHNFHMTAMRREIDYLKDCFDVMYKYKYVLDEMVSDYFQDDEKFKYRNVLENLEADLVTVVNRNEDQYQRLVSDIETDLMLTEDDQIEFITQVDDPTDNGILPSVYGTRSTLVNGSDSGNFQGNILKLPGQRVAEMPECPACGYKAKTRLKLESHILEHEDNPLVVCVRDDCGESYPLHLLSAHEKDYHPESHLICEMCNAEFDSKSILIQHYKLHIKRKEKFRCDFPGCEYTDIYIGRMDRHKQSAHGITVSKHFKCSVESCGRVFKDRASFYSHSLIHRDRSLVYKHRCTVDGCMAVFKRRRNLVLHMARHGQTVHRYNCNIGVCKRTYSREKELLKHVEQCHRGFSSKPSTSSSAINTTISDVSMISTDGGEDDGGGGGGGGDQSTLKSEKNRSVDNDQSTIYIENELGQMVKVSANAVNESQTSGAASGGGGGGGNGSTNTTVGDVEMEVDGTDSVKLDHTVDDGGKIVVLMARPTRSSGGGGGSGSCTDGGDHSDDPIDIVAKDLSEILVDGETLTNECEICSIQFDTSADLIVHLKERHHQYTIRAYRCDFDHCTFATHFRSILGKHKNVVHGGKYRCEYCGKLSKDSGNHNRHRNIHKQILFRCRYEGCEAVYKSHKAYTVHVLTHSNDQPIYRCDHPGCTYITYYVNTLSVHKLTHSDVRRFFCPYDGCGKGFKRNGDLNKHVTHSHKGVKRPAKKRKSVNTTQQQSHIVIATNVVTAAAAAVAAGGGSVVDGDVGGDDGAIVGVVDNTVDATQMEVMEDV